MLVSCRHYLSLPSTRPCTFRPRSTRPSDWAEPGTVSSLLLSVYNVLVAPPPPPRPSITLCSFQMKVVGLLSGGKDSCYNLLQCVAAGHEVTCLANLAPRDPACLEADSHMYQTIGWSCVAAIAEAMELPLYVETVAGTSVSVGRDYERCEEDEVGVTNKKTIFPAIIRPNNSAAGGGPGAAAGAGPGGHGRDGGGRGRHPVRLPAGAGGGRVSEAGPHSPRLPVAT